jgi:hypothetical protein
MRVNRELPPEMSFPLRILGVICHLFDGTGEMLIRFPPRSYLPTRSMTI